MNAANSTPNDSPTRSHFLRPLVVAVATAVAIAVMPAAEATATTQCRDTGGGKVCQRQGSAKIHATPTPRSPNGSLFSNAWLPGYGRGHLPPLLALD